MDATLLAAIDHAIAPLPALSGEPAPPALLILKYGAGKPLIVSLADPADASHVAVLVATAPAGKSGFFSRRKPPANYRANIEHAAGLHAALSARLGPSSAAVVVVQDLSRESAAGELGGLLAELAATSNRPPVSITLLGYGPEGTALTDAAQEAGLGAPRYLPNAKSHTDMAAFIAGS